MGSRDNAFGIATRLRIGQRGNRGSIPVGARVASLLHSVDTGTGIHPVSYTVIISTGMKVREAYHLHLVPGLWMVKPTLAPPHAFMA
jgi:hypothetical protein